MKIKNCGYDQVFYVGGGYLIGDQDTYEGPCFKWSGADVHVPAYAATAEHGRYYFDTAVKVIADMVNTQRASDAEYKRDMEARRAANPTDPLRLKGAMIYG